MCFINIKCLGNCIIARSAPALPNIDWGSPIYDQTYQPSQNVDYTCTTNCLLVWWMAVSNNANDGLYQLFVNSKTLGFASSVTSSQMIWAKKGDLVHFHTSASSTRFTVYAI